MWHMQLSDPKAIVGGVKIGSQFYKVYINHPIAKVGGVKIGSQFYKVYINHPIAKDEPLVGPMPGCNNIGDVQAKGVPIAWPSMFICSNKLS